MASKFIHDFSLCTSITNRHEDFEDSVADDIIAALEKRLRDLKAHKENWRDYVDHFATNEEIP